MVAFALLKPYGMALGDTGRTDLIALSRWRHGFESRTGCQGSTRSEPLFRFREGWLPGFLDTLPIRCRSLWKEKSDEGFHAAARASWELRVFLGPDPLTGRKRYATRTVRGGKREAQTALAEMVTEAERGLTVRTTATVGELLEAWFESAAPDFRRRRSSRHGATSTAR